jgi:hypothetical protein
MPSVLPLVAALLLVAVASPPRQALAGDCQASCQLTLARCIQSGGGNACSKPWRSCVADKGCEGAYGLARELGTADTEPPQASPRERPASAAPPAGSGPPARQPNKGSRWLPVPAY